MIGIYKITNPKGKIYIGQSINIDRRFKEYKKIQCSQSIKLYNSFQKYGVENHIFEILEECNTDQLNEKEEFYIKFFNSHIKGLNIKLASNPSWTGKKRPEHSMFLKENGCGLSYERTQEHKDNLSTMMKEVWNNNVKFAVIVDNLSSKCSVKMDFVGMEVNKAENNVWIDFPWEDWWTK
jgi:group I intron endonuclease